MEALLQHSAEVDVQNAKGCSALMLSARNGHAAITQLLCQQSTVDLKDVKGRTALHHAAMRGHQQVVTCLLNASADVDCLDARGRTPLHLSSLGSTETWQTRDFQMFQILHFFLHLFLQSNEMGQYLQV